MGNDEDGLTMTTCWAPIARSVWLLGFLWFATSVAYAADIQGRFHVLGLGTDRCDEFVASIDQEGTSDPWSRFNLYTAYATGYLTSYNQLVEDTVDIKGTRKMLEIMEMIETFCDENPLQDFHAGLMHAVSELRPYRER